MLVYGAGVATGVALALGGAYVYSWLWSGAAYRLRDRVRARIKKLFD